MCLCVIALFFLFFLFSLALSFTKTLDDLPLFLFPDLWLCGSQETLLAAACHFRVSPHAHIFPLFHPPPAELLFLLSSVSYFSASLSPLPCLKPLVSCLLYCSHPLPLSDHCSVLSRSPSSSLEPLEEHHVAQLLRRFSTDLSLGRHLSLDQALAHHLHQCSYHLRLFRNWLISGHDPLEYLHGQPLAPPSIPQLHALLQPQLAV